MVAGRFQDFRVQKMISHYEFVELNPNGFSKEYTHDIALLKLDREAILNAWVFSHRLHSIASPATVNLLKLANLNQN